MFFLFQQLDNSTQHLSELEKSLKAEQQKAEDIRQTLLRRLAETESDVFARLQCQERELQRQFELKKQELFQKYIDNQLVSRMRDIKTHVCFPYLSFSLLMVALTRWCKLPHCGDWHPAKCIRPGRQRWKPHATLSTGLSPRQPKQNINVAAWFISKQQASNGLQRISLTSTSLCRSCCQISSLWSSLAGLILISILMLT